MRVRNALRAGLQFLSAKMDGVIVTVVHDEFRGMGLGNVRGFVGEGAVVVDVRGMFGGGGGGTDGVVLWNAVMKKVITRFN